MTSIPPAIIFINSDINAELQSNLTNQLYIDEAMTDVEFDARVVADPNYPVVVHLADLRILVIRQTYQDFTNRQYADIVLFIKQGMATVLQNNNGPPTFSISIERINIFNLLNSIKKTCFAFSCQKCKCTCCCNCFKHLPEVLQRMLIDPFDISGVHNANCDNEFNNEAWINRK